MLPYGGDATSSTIHHEPSNAAICRSRELRTARHQNARNARPPPDDRTVEPGSRPFDIGWGVSLPRPYNEAAEGGPLIAHIPQPGLEEFVSLHAIPKVVNRTDPTINVTFSVS